MHYFITVYVLKLVLGLCLVTISLDRRAKDIDLITLCLVVSILKFCAYCAQVVVMSYFLETYEPMRRRF